MITAKAERVVRMGASLPPRMRNGKMKLLWQIQIFFKIIFLQSYPLLVSSFVIYGLILKPVLKLI
jgi:hypothetical protein